MLDVFKQFQASVEIKTRKKCICNDNGGDYCGLLTKTTCIKVWLRFISLMAGYKDDKTFMEGLRCFSEVNFRTHFGGRLYYPLHMLLMYILLFMCKVMFKIDFGKERMLPLTI